jgi:hypothetical protein
VGGGVPSRGSAQAPGLQHSRSARALPSTVGPRWPHTTGHSVTTTTAPPQQNPADLGVSRLSWAAAPSMAGVLAHDPDRIPAELMACPLSRRCVHVICDRANFQTVLTGRRAFRAGAFRAGSRVMLAGRCRPASPPDEARPRALRGQCRSRHGEAGCRRGRRLGCPGNH